VAVCWLAAESMTGSVVTATVLLVVIAGLGVAVVAGLRAMGITRDHPWLRRMAARPWRDGQDVLNVALRHLPEVFVLTPSGSLIAPDIVELQMNPGDLAALREWMELDVVSASATEVYEDQVAKRGARFAGPGRPEVYVVPDNSLPQGRYRLRRGLPESARYSPGPWDRQGAPDFVDRQHSYDDRPYAGQEYAGQGYSDQEYAGQEYAGQEYAGQEYADQEYAGQEYAATALDPVAAGSGGRGRPEDRLGRTVMDGMATVMEQIRPAVPVLRLVTGSSVSETSESGARAGRGLVELVLPDVPTVSRVHATFTFAAGRWWVTNQGVNGLSVNAAQVSGKHPLSDGDSIRWGTRPDAPLSRVEIG